MPSIAVSRKYEATYILRPDASEEVVETTIAKYRNVVESKGGTIDKIVKWDRRKLAYEVKGCTEGLYVIMQFSGFPAVEAELRRIFQISEDQIRTLIVAADENSTLPEPQAAAFQSAPAAPPPPAPVAAAPVEAAPAEVAEPAAAEAVAEPIVEAVAEPVAEATAETTEEVAATAA